MKRKPKIKNDIPNKAIIVRNKGRYKSGKVREYYQYTDSSNKKHYVSRRVIKNEREAKRYFQNKGYFIGSRIYLASDKKTVKVGKNYISAVSSTYLHSNRVVLTGEYVLNGKTYIGHSSPINNPSKADIREAKNQVIFTLGYQIASNKGFVISGDTELSDDKEEAIEEEAQLINAHDITWSYTYSKEITS